jgi:hypothetical protein
LCSEVRSFAKRESKHAEPALYGVTDGKAVGTYFEQKFIVYLRTKYEFGMGSAALGVDFPELRVDIKVTSIRQPQSSCPYTSARQKVYGLGYSRLVFVYDKTDDHRKKAGKLNVRHVIFVKEERTADYQTTSGLLKLIQNNANEDDIVAFLHERNLPVEDIQAAELSAEIIRNPPNEGFLTISNALQWRLQYRRVIAEAGNITGLERVL